MIGTGNAINLTMQRSFISDSKYIFIEMNLASKKTITAQFVAPPTVTSQPTVHFALLTVHFADFTMNRVFL